MTTAVRNRRGDRAAIPGIAGVIETRAGRWGVGGITDADGLRWLGIRTLSERVFPNGNRSAQIQDCKAAVRFLRANANEFGIDTSKIGAIGHSAGGHLTALLATSAGVPELEGEGGNAEFSSAIQAVVPMGGQTDFLSQRTRDISGDETRGKIWRQFLGGSLDDQPDTYRLASPLVHLDKTDPPCWLITGENDDPSTRAADLREKMKKFGIATGLTIIKDAPHPFTIKQTWFDEAMDKAGEFFIRHLKKPTS